MDDLNKLLHETIEYHLTDFHTAMAGVVEKYNPKTRRADIQPSLKRKMPGGKFMDFPVIPDVPVRYSGSMEFTIHFPLKKGDEVLLLFTERATDKWKTSGGKGIEEPDPRRFDLQDCVAVPGLQAIDFIPVEEEGLNIVHKTKPDGDFISQVKMDDAKVEIKYKEKADVIVEDDHITAKTEKCTAEMTKAKISLVNGQDKITADGGNVEVDAATKATIKSPQVEITGGTFTMKGSVAPGTGPLCAIPNCLFTGAPHGGSQAAGT
jgi:hypothetical protein